MKTANKLKLVVGLVVLFAGLDLTILLSHTSRFVGIVLIIVGVGLLFWALEERKIPREKKVKIKKKEEGNIATRIIDFLTLNGRLKPLLPVVGIGIIVLIGYYNLFYSDKSYLGSNDYVTLILAGVLIIYNFIPSKYSTERDFAFLFSILLFILLVIPTTILSLTSGEVDTNSPLTYYLLSLPTVGLVSLFGISAITPGINPQTGIPAFNYIEIFGPDGNPIPVSISLSCSGLYSVAIFVSAFIAFVAIEYRRVDRRVFGLLGLGIFLAWCANILRMAIILAVGRYHGRDTMLWVHNNIGEIIFMIWVIIFWLIMFKYLGVWDREKSEPKKGKISDKGKCMVCSEDLSPVIPSVRCDCGTISHSGCILTNDHKCPKCGEELSPDSSNL